MSISCIITQNQILRDAILSRNLSLGNHQFKEITKGRKPYLDKSGLLHWPVVFLYGEVMASDIIEDFCETDLFVPHIEEISISTNYNFFCSLIDLFH